MSERLPNEIIFFIGTDAELIKLFPVVLEAKKAGLRYAIVSSGQNDISRSFILNEALQDRIDLTLSEESSIVKSAPGLLAWFMRTNRIAAQSIRQSIPYTDRTVFVVHGDTVSTVMGSFVAKKLKLRLAHIEAGLRSHNWLNPFPEEIDRSIVSRRTAIHFAPGDEATENLRKLGTRSIVVNTGNNTLLDSLEYSKSVPCKDPAIQEICSTEHCVMVMHRQENLQSKQLLRDFCEVALRSGERCRTVVILHEPTRIALKNEGLLDALTAAEGITLLPRVEYFDFMKLLDSSEYVLTDGGSNQEELSYMGTPCLILRSHTERSEGLGKNIRLFDGTKQDMLAFCDQHASYRREPVRRVDSPSAIIVSELAAQCGR